jgi:hypothetical protein
MLTDLWITWKTSEILLGAIANREYCEEVDYHFSKKILQLLCDICAIPLTSPHFPHHQNHWKYYVLSMWHLFDTSLYGGEPEAIDFFRVGRLPLFFLWKMETRFSFRSQGGAHWMETMAPFLEAQILSNNLVLWIFACVIYLHSTIRTILSCRGESHVPVWCQFSDDRRRFYCGL